jgi:hypothetical protein
MGQLRGEHYGNASYFSSRGDVQGAYCTRLTLAVARQSKFFMPMARSRSHSGREALVFCWRKRDCSPHVPNGPFVVCLDAYRDALDGALQNGADRDAVA